MLSAARTTDATARQADEGREGAAGLGAAAAAALWVRRNTSLPPLPPPRLPSVSAGGLRWFFVLRLIRLVRVFHLLRVRSTLGHAGCLRHLLLCMLCLS